MFTKIKNFQAIVECGSFTEAALERNISQSAISQQIQSLENEVGVPLINRDKRKVSLTPSGEVFYRKSLVLLAEYEQIIRDTQKAAKTDGFAVKVGITSLYGSDELQLAIAEFSKKYPDIDIETVTAGHETLRKMLQSGTIDIALNDHRRSFSNAAENRIVQKQKCYVEISKDNPLTKLSYLTASDLQGIPCILIADEKEHFDEKQYYTSTFSITSECIYAKSIKEARLMVVAGKGYIIMNGTPAMSHFSETIDRIPYYIGSQQFERNLCIFYMKDNAGYYIEDFADILEQKFLESTHSKYL